jgi:hypothetical protein
MVYLRNDDTTAARDIQRDSCKTKISEMLDNGLHNIRIVMEYSSSSCLATWIMLDALQNGVFPCRFRPGTINPSPNDLRCQVLETDGIESFDSAGDLDRRHVKTSDVYCPDDRWPQQWVLPVDSGRCNCIVKSLSARPCSIRAMLLLECTMRT